MKKLVLASRSPRRIELLRSRGLEFEILPAEVEEVVDPGLSPEENALALARQKARAVRPARPGACILAADTLVALDSEILGKPLDRADAARMLSRLSGRGHRVITGIAVIDPEGTLRSVSESSEVHIRPLSPEEIEAYIATGEPMDKAGAYAIQGVGANLVQSWEGSYENIVGLPMDRVLDLLGEAGFTAADAPPAP